MFEEHEGEFAYSVRRLRSATGEVGWNWEIRHRVTGALTNAGRSLRSHDAAKTAALDAISLASRIRRAR